MDDYERELVIQSLQIRHKKGNHFIYMVNFTRQTRESHLIVSPAKERISTWQGSLEGDQGQQGNKDTC